jgi:hypothetical protein
MEEAWTVVFRNLYTGFLLRDFAGKIVPGILLLFSIVTIFRDPKQVVLLVKNEISLFAVLLLAGFAWTVTLGTQSLAEGLGIWSYFPAPSTTPHAETHLKLSEILHPGPDDVFDADTMTVDKFQELASEDEKQQYERFVVIKEACGNLFAASLLSIPAFAIGAFIRTERPWTAQIFHRLPSQNIQMGVALLYALCIFIGLHRMHAQHVNRQLWYAKEVGVRLEAKMSKHELAENLAPKTESKRGDAAEPSIKIPTKKETVHRAKSHHLAKH